MNAEIMIQEILKNNPIARDNPMVRNAFELYNAGRTKDLETLARNIYQSKGQDINEALKLLS